jgi:arginyl-tRNA synthetase
VRGTLDRFGVRFDNWFSERDLYSRGEVDAALAQLDRQGHTYRSDEALWLRTTTFGDDKDRVLIRANGEPTYLAADVAYHWDKLERGFERLVDILGADHHGYVARLRAAIAGLGADPERFEALIMRLVHIVEDGKRAEMSKRSGEFVTLDELLDDIGVDATRWFMLWRSHDTTVDLDLELARRQSNDNPVYYVQYAHARIASILRKAGVEPEQAAAAAGAETPGTALEPAERELLKRLIEFSGEVHEAAERRAPHRICTFSTAVAADFHGFYRDCQVVGAEDPGARAWRSPCWPSGRSRGRSASLVSPPPSGCDAAPAQQERGAGGDPCARGNPLPIGRPRPRRVGCVHGPGDGPGRIGHGAPDRPGGVAGGAWPRRRRHLPGPARRPAGG